MSFKLYNHSGASFTFEPRVQVDPDNPVVFKYDNDPIEKDIKFENNDRKFRIYDDPTLDDLAIFVLATNLVEAGGEENFFKVIEDIKAMKVVNTQFIFLDVKDEPPLPPLLPTPFIGDDLVKLEALLMESELEDKDQILSLNQNFKAKTIVEQ